MDCGLIPERGKRFIILLSI